MPWVAVEKSEANKITPAKGDTLASLAKSKACDAGTTWEMLALYNWGTKDPVEVNRALVELLGCSKVEAEPEKSVIDPDRGTLKVLWAPRKWQKPKLAVKTTHTVEVKKRLPMTAVAITELTSWFSPNTTKTCSLKYRLEGAPLRADKTDVEVHVAGYLDSKSRRQSSYYEIKTTPRDTSKPSGPDNPVERNEVPCDTDQPGDTHVWLRHADGVAPAAEVATTWDGESTAKKGVLAPTSSTKAYVNSTCAPYTVLIRYYKSDADKNARIRFQRSFYPRWTLVAGPAWTLVEESLVVKWALEKDNGKLKLGQLVVWDKDGTVVLRVALDRTQLEAGQLDLKALWPSGTPVARDKTPYRVQIQAHSDANENEGLALAIMPTQVRAFAYDKVQLIAFNVRPPAPYAGDADDDTDIAARCRIMRDAVEVARGQADAASDVLKVFVAPEFYFRGLHGAYPVERIETILPQLRTESDKIDYADWMFVFGTAIGYEKHGDTGAPLQHDGAGIVGLPKSGPITRLLVKTPVAARIPSTTVGGYRWEVVQGTTKAFVTGANPTKTPGEYVLTLAAPAKFKMGACVLSEPVSTEITNSALVQKGYPSPHMGDGSLRQAIVYKEKISPIDFKTNATQWHAADASERKITIHGVADRPVIPTSGALDLAGASPNVTRPTGSAVGSEVNQQGLGGGVVLTMDEVTFGLEVCLDHGQNRLANFYVSGNRRAGDRKPQVHLIPSWGMTIGGGTVVSPPTQGVVFNVDGASTQSVARINDGKFSCDTHVSVTLTAGGRCAVVDTFYWCKGCDYLGSAATCPTCKKGSLPAFSRCGNPSAYGCQIDCNTSGCSHTEEWLYVCRSCSKVRGISLACGCPLANPEAIRCKEYYPVGGDCSKCTTNNPACGEYLQRIGSTLAPGSPHDVTSAALPNAYFQGPTAGHVLVYPVKDLAAAEVV